MTDEARAAFELQELVDRWARAHMDRVGRLPTAVELNPGTPGAALLVGYTVVLDPEVPVGAGGVW